MKNILFAVLVTALAAFESCKPECEEPVVFNHLQDTVELCVGQPAISEVGQHSITVLAVPADNRCPEGVNCVIAGWAETQLLLKSGANVVTRTIAFGDATAYKDTTNFGDLRVKVIGVKPGTKTDKKIKQSEYKIRLAIGGKQ